MTDIGFLDRLGPAAREELERHLVKRRYHLDEVIIEQSDDTDDVFFVLEGNARVTIYSEEGKVVSYRHIPERDIFGELAAIDHQPRSATVVAGENLLAGCLTIQQFRRLVETVPDITWALLSHLSHENREMTARIFEYSTMLVRERLIVELVRQARNAAADATSAQLRPAPTHFDLAARISSHREAVSREMSKLTKQGLLRKSGGALIVTDIDRLEEMVRVDV